MTDDAQCPLGASLLLLLQESVDAGTTDAKTLSLRLSRSRATVVTQLKLICELLEVHSPEAAVAAALRHGWIKPLADAPAAPPEDAEELPP
jgi:hypothetical protein